MSVKILPVSEINKLIYGDNEDETFNRLRELNINNVTKVVSGNIIKIENVNLLHCQNIGITGEELVSIILSSSPAIGEVALCGTTLLVKFK